jgi:hypothetical protein
MIKQQTHHTKTMAEKNLGIIASRVLYYHRRLPQHVRVAYDVEDMIQEVVLHVVSVTGKMALELQKDGTIANVFMGSSFDAGRARDTTWTWHVANNRCKAIMLRYNLKRNTADVVSLTSEVEQRLKANSVVELREARSAVERVIEVASDGAAELLSQIFEGNAPALPSPGAVEDLLEAARRCRATLRDFQLVYREAVL